MRIEGYPVCNWTLKVETDNKIDQLSFAEISFHFTNISILSDVEYHFSL